MIHYTVQCQFHSDDPSIPQRWLAWLREIHLAEVIAGGAMLAQVIQMDAAEPTYEIRYQFPSREAFQRYEVQFAPALRKEGLQMFPLELGLTYQRNSGEQIFQYPE